MFEQALSVLATSIVTTLMLCIVGFYFLRKLNLDKILKGASGLASLGAKVAGEQSGFIRGSKAVQEQAAEQFLQSPQLAGIKMLGSQFGFDIDSMIEEHGALETIAGLSQVLGMLGIDINTLATQGLQGVMKGVLGKKEGSGGIP